MRIQKNENYAVYGAGRTGCSAIDHILNYNSTVVCIVDADPNKWGSTIKGIKIEKPEQLIHYKGKFAKIVIASTFYKQIRETLLNLGFTDAEFLLYD
ncbi:nucleoside-diphosphate sugar epimerase/dehydratase [Bilifractor sp. LCP21S3_A7]|uniref:nucleoside-diphosphate sugar epimerase/dehydratase n=1 Tax=Bilifractor sp. LCP21S3_A7 TaxID=3438738 RepID=UPI003F90FFF7